MTRNKLKTVFLIMVIGFNILLVRLAVIAGKPDYRQTVQSQSTRSATIASQRPDFIDRNGCPLVSTDYEKKYLVIPESPDCDAFLLSLEGDGRELFERKIAENRPFLIDYPTKMPLTEVMIRERYTEEGLLSHTIGYLDAGGGASGLELALEEYLSENTLETVVSYEVNARGTIALDSEPRLREQGESEGAVWLTVDAEIQRLCERIADEALETGAIVVADCKTGELCALVSRPDFEQNDISGSLTDENCSFVNRCFLSYNAGSVYKPVIAAAALESGLGGFCHECTGSIEVDGRTYTCNKGTAHGLLDMKGALSQSCNTYFVALGQRVGAERISYMSSLFGFGMSTEFADGFESSAGIVPTTDELSVSGELCNHCFGQGRLLVTPVQIAEMAAAIANGGNYNEPALVTRIGKSELALAGANRVISEQTAKKLADCLAEAVNSGTATSAQPLFSTAACKTGTAQTGRVGHDGTELLIGWCAGWFPTDEPKYAVAVMTEDAGYGYLSAAPVFRRIADGITVLEDSK